ncbi:PAS domain S-box protein [Pedobacter gandavensis]|uniref:PAS domain S-box protein n=1 Tax=Pedobacter TaxID=84567 RepID=UPI001C998916|nr:MULTISPECIES: PAS domain S-box protein [Pedobacter]WGQ07485.1 PAS domain S-box protein [Pedobacter gandavensis]
MLTNNHTSSTYEMERLRALQDCDILDTPPEQEFDNITKLASLICNTPIAVIALVDEDRLWFKSVIGLDCQQLPRSYSFAEQAIQSDHILEVCDATADERFSLHPSVIDDHHLRYYAAAPLIDEDGYRLGTICVFDREPRAMTPAQKEGLEILAKEVITHISLRKKAKELSLKAQRFEELLNISTVSPEIHCILDDKGELLFVNNAVTTVLEYEVEEAIGLTAWTFCYRDDIDRVVEALEAGLANGTKQFNIDFRIVTKSGLIRWLSWNMVSKNKRWYAYGRDITENKRVENELMKLSFVASKVNNAVVINDSDNHVTWVNAAFEKITGFTLEDMKGKRLGDLIQGPGTDLELIEQARELTNRHQSFTVDLLAYRKDKQPIWLSIYNTVVFNDEGKVEIEVEIILDITEKKKAEEELQLLSLVASKTDTGVNISDGEGFTTWINHSMEKLTGYTLNELQGRRLGDILSKDEAQRELIVASRKKANNRESYSIEVQAKKKSGEPIWLSVSNTPIVNEKGKVERQIDLITDISQRKQVEKEMVEAKEQALQLSAAKEMFLSVMSHEIRTPLNAVIGMAHLLLDNDPKESQLPDLNLLRFSAENLLNIINDILDLTKMETGNVQLETIPFSIKTLVSDVINSLQMSVVARNNKLELSCDESIPQYVKGDKTRLYQVLMNLLGNAIKFTQDGKIILEVKMLSEEKDRVLLHFEVKDTGIGIAEEKLAYIFQPFIQARTDISRKYGGTGLGLTITKKMLELYGSDIQVKSVEGKGTVFQFNISFEKANDYVPQVKVFTEPDMFTNKWILVVDDNEINALIAKRIFGKWGLNLDFAITGEEALEKVRDNVYDLIFMDIKMPGIDGFEATTLIRAMDGDYFKKVPILALTASTLHDEHNKFSESGMNGHILKPFKPEDMRNILSEYLS